MKSDMNLAKIISLRWFSCLFLALGLAGQATALQINWTSSTNFYVDFSSTPTPMNCDYVSCLITNSDGIAYSNLWITVNSFTNTAMTLGGGDPGQYAMGTLGNNQGMPVFFYLQATNDPGTTPYKDQFTISVYQGYPATGTLLAQSNFVVTVTTSGANQANKVTSLTCSPTNNPVVGGIVKISVQGTTGNVAEGNDMTFTAGALTNWNAGAFELVACSIVITSSPNVVLSNVLDTTSTFHITGTGEPYQADYWFRAVAVTQTNTPVSPVSFINNGGGTINHVQESSLLTLPPVIPPTNMTTLAPVASFTQLYTNEAVTFALRFTNASTIDVTIDRLVDTLPPGFSYVTNSSTFHGASILDPASNSLVLTWSQTYLVPAGMSRDFAFRAIPTIGGYATNSVVAYVKNTQIDTTLDTSDSAPANETVRVLLAPTAVNVSTNTLENAALTVPAPGVLAQTIDPNGFPLTIIGYTQPTHGTVTVNADGSYAYTPAPFYWGADGFTFTLTNGNLRASTGTNNLTVTWVNQPPTLNAIGNVNLVENWSLQTVNFDGVSAGQANESSETLSVTATSSNPSFIPNPTVTYTSPSATGSLTFAPVTNTFGAATITVVVRDDGGTANGGVDSVTNSFTVTEQGLTNYWYPGSHLVVNVSDTPGAAGVGYTQTNYIGVLSVLATSTNPFTINVDSFNGGSPGAAANFDSASNYAWTIATTTRGVIGLTSNQVIVDTSAFSNDLAGLSFAVLLSGDGSSVNLVFPANRPPVVNAGLSQTNSFGTPISLSGTVADDGLPVGAPVTATWSQVSGPGTISFANVHLTNTTVTASQGGIYTLRLTADDTLATNSADVTTKFNRAPVAQGQSVSGHEGQASSVTLGGTDPDGDPITFAVTQGPAWGTLTGTAPNLTYTPNSGFFGQDGFSFVATDGLATSAVALVSITVAPNPRSRTYTLNADFLQGQFFKALEVTNDELMLRSKAEAFNNLWVAVSTKGTIVRVDTDTGEIKGEYKSAPDGEPLSPSRTTVDMDGSVWAANRNGNSVVHISVPEAGLWKDRNTNGVLDTSTGLGDVRPWPNPNHIDSNGGVSSAQDELIIHYVKVRASGTRHVSVDSSNNVWVSGTSRPYWDYIDGVTGNVIRQEPSVGYGGYGGLIDRKGVIWSSPLMRWDTSKPLTGPSGSNWIAFPYSAYGLGLDSRGHVWVSQLGGGKILKFAPSGVLLGSFYQGNANAQGVAVGLDDDVWVAHSLVGGTTVGHLKNDGTLVGNVKVGSGPTGVAVDAKGKIWVANYYSGNVMRIDPTLGPVGADGKTPIGQVDYVSPYLGGNLYNYSDMTGSTLIGFPGDATWTVIYDCTIPQASWGPVTWNSKIYNDGSIQVVFAASDDGVNFGPEEVLPRPNAIPASIGRYAKLKLTFNRSSSGKGPILDDITLATTGYNGQLVQPTATVDAGPDHDLQLPLADQLQASVVHNGFLTYNTNQTFTWSMVSGPGTVTFGNSNAAATSARFSTQGVYVVRAQTTLSGTIYSDDVQINATPINRPPWVDVGPNRAFRSTNDVLHIEPIATDDGLPAGSVLTVQWTKIIGPGTVTFSAPNSTTNDIAFSAPGIYILQLSASDGQLSYAARLEVRVQAVCLVQAPSGIAQWWTGNAETRECVRGNDMNLFNGAGYAPAQISYGFSFNGTTNYAKAYEHPAMDIGSEGSMTIEFWAKASSSGRLFDWYRNGVSGIYADYNTSGNSLTFHLIDTNGVDHSLSVGAALSTSQFQHVALTYDRNVGVTTVYTNGVIASNPSLGAFSPRTTGDLYLAGGPQDPSHFGGIVDELSLYNRALNGEEVYNIFTANFVGKCPVDNNLPPVVTAGNPISLPGAGTAVLNGSATDDGLPVGSTLYSEWRTLGGPTNVILANSNSPVTAATFPAPGLYVLQLYADDSVKSATDQVGARIGAVCSVKNIPGLVAWWPGNNSTADVFGHDSLIRVNRASYTNGMVGAAFNFNGANNYLWTPAQPAFDVGQNTNGFTLEFWVKGPYSGGTARAVVGWNNQTDRGVKLTQNYDTLYLRIWGTNGTPHDLSSVGSVFNSNWHHVALAYNRATGQAWTYLDGVLQHTDTIGSFVPETDYDFYVGEWPGYSYFSGQVDELSLYTRPLNPQEVYQIYASGSAGKCPNDNNTAPLVYAGPDLFVEGVPGAATLEGEVWDDGLPAGSTLRIQWSKFSGPGVVTFNSPTSAVTAATFSTNGIYVLQLTADDGEVQTSELVEVRVETLCTVNDPAGLSAWWPANGTSFDVMGGRAAILVSGTTYASGKVASSFSLNGANNYVWMPAQANYDVGKNTNGFTLEFWVKGPSSGATPRAVVGWNNQTDRGVKLTQSYDTLYLQIWETNGTNHNLSAVAGVFNNNWHHVALTYDRALGQARTYLDAVLQHTDTIGSFVPETDYDFYIGQWPGYSFLSGQVDELSLYQRPLNPQEIYNVYASGSAGKCPNDINTAPFVYAGPDLFVEGVPGAVTLEGEVWDDGLPAASAPRIRWSELNGPGVVTFGSPTSAVTMATFSTNGIYVLQLTADDGELQSSDLVEVRVETLCTVNDPAGLSAWWPANGTSFDVVGGQSAILVSGTTYAAGKVASSFSLNGVNNYVWMPAQANYDVGKSTNGFTLEFWVKTPGSSATPRAVVGWNNQTDRGVKLTQSYDALCLQIWETNATDHGLTAVAGVFNNNWHHVALTYDRALGQARTYLDGAPQHTDTIGSFVPETDYDFYIGEWPGYGFFSGQVDELSLYQRPLSPQEVYNVYASGSAGKCPNDNNNAAPVVFAGPNLSLGSVTNVATLFGVATDDGLPLGSLLRIRWTNYLGPGTVSFGSATSAVSTATFSTNGLYLLQLTADDGEIQSSSLMQVRVGIPCSVLDPPGLSAFWPANGTSLDVIGGQSAILAGGTTYAQGEVASSFSLNGVSSYVSMPAQATYDVGKSTNGFTVEFWVKGSSSGGTARTVLGWNNQTDRGVRLWQNFDTLYVRIWETNGTAHDLLSVGSVFNNRWHHLALAYDRAAGQARTYLDGVLQHTDTIGTFVAETDYDFYIGEWPTNSFFSGQVDELSLYTRPLAQSEIQAIFNAGSSGKCITPANQPPTVLAGGDQTIYLPTNTITLHGAAYDDGLPSNILQVAWTYLTGPSTIFFSSTNTAVTTVTFTNTGAYTFQLSASDGQYTVSNTARVTVLADPRIPPTVSLTSPTNGTLILLPTNVPSTTLTFAATASDPDDPIRSVEFILNGSSLGTLTSSPYTLSITNESPGVYTATAVATDLSGLSTTSAPVVVSIYTDTGAPTVAISAPDDAAIITASSNVIGAASSPILTSYQLQYRLKNPDGAPPALWIVLASGSASVTNGTLGSLDPTMLLNGIYELQLVATDMKGRTSLSGIQTFVVERNLKIGNFTLSFRDLNVPVAGTPIEIVRTYDSRDQRTNDFGVGWSLELRNVRLQKTRSLGPNWYQDYYPDPLFASYALDPVQPREITITLADNKVYHFQALVTPSQQFFYPIEDVHMTFTNMPGTYGGLAIDGDNEATVDSPSGYANLININDFSYFNPTRFRLTNEVGEVYIIDENAGLQSMADRNGNALLISTNGVIWTNTLTGTSGIGITFLRDAQGRITNIVDPEGLALTYTYGTNGSLAGFTDRVTNTTTFSYTNVLFPHYLTGITDPRGIQAIRAEFDDSGRMVRQIDADGNVINFDHDFTNGREIITDRLGHTTVHYYDDRGNVLATIDALSNVTTFKYDDVDNLLEKVDALGNTNRYTYDGEGNKLTETDPLGFTTRYTYGPYRTLTSITNPRQFTTTNTYDPATGDLLSERDPLGKATSYTYDGSGNLRTRTDALGNVMTNAFDSAGHMNYTAVLDVGGHLLTASSFGYDANGNQTNKTTWRTTPGGVQTLVTTYVFDHDSRLVQTIHPDGSSNTTVYALGLDKPAVEIDPLGQPTLHFYDERGNLTNTVYPDLAREYFGFDAENRQISMTDRAGRTTFYTNDALGRLTDVRYPSGATTNIVYDGLGRIIRTTDERHNSTSFAYDPNCGCSGRQAFITNALGQVTHRGYDENANETSATDASGRTTTYVYDPLDRRTQVWFIDGSSTLTTYDALGRRIAETDQNTNATWFGYDGLGRLVGVTNALGHVTTYGYDELGSLVRQTDAEGRTTTFEYDSLGRRTKRTLPLSQVETYQYDPAGNLTNRVDFNGRLTAYAYDAANRLLSKTPDPVFSAPPVSFTYTATGRRATMSDASGTTTYLYNERDWLTNKTVRWNLPAGSRYTAILGYTHDPHGNLTGIESSDPNGTAVGYEYDALNRLSRVNDARLGCCATNGYDAVGNLQSQAYPNGVSSSYQYDSLNRLTNLTTLNAQAGLVAKYDYTVAAGGKRLTAAENVATTNGVQTINRVYNYDAIYRLTGESLSVSGPVGLPESSSLGYTHDRVGNRLARSSTLSQLPSASYGYDANDRLTSDTYDNNGNTVVGRVSPGAPTVSDSYDFEDRLINRNNGQITITYDGDGNRMSKTVGGLTTLYLVDEQNPSGYVQVLEEYVSQNSSTPTLRAVFTYGLDLISQDQVNGTQWTPCFYGYDGHGSVRYLTDIAGNVTDTYDYDAFGTLLAQSGLTPNSYRYCGEQFDADLGLYYNRARYLNTDAGRFWTRDHFQGMVREPLSQQLYLYGRADAVNRVDPTGFFTMAELMTAMGVNNQQDAARAISANKARRKTVQTLGCVFGVEGLKRSIDYEFHHPISLSMGGPDKNLFPLPVDTHRMFHFVLNILIKEEIPGFSNYTSQAKWAEKLLDRAERKALLAIYKTAARYVDKQCKLPKAFSLVTYIQKNEAEWLK